MDTQTPAALQIHLDSIAAILIKEADHHDMKPLAGRESCDRLSPEVCLTPLRKIFIDIATDRKRGKT